MDYEIPQAGLERTGRCSTPRNVERDLRKFGRSDRKGARKRGSCSYVGIGAATLIGVQTCIEDEGSVIEKTACGI